MFNNKTFFFGRRRLTIIKAAGLHTNPPFLLALSSSVGNPGSSQISLLSPSSSSLCQTRCPFPYFSSILLHFPEKFTGELYHFFIHLQKTTPACQQNIIACAFPLVRSSGGAGINGQECAFLHELHCVPLCVRCQGSLPDS